MGVLVDGDIVVDGLRDGGRVAVFAVGVFEGDEVRLGCSLSVSHDC